MAQQTDKHIIRQRFIQKFLRTCGRFRSNSRKIAVIVEIIEVMVKLRCQRFVVVDSIGLKCDFMLQNNCPPMIKIEVGKMQGLSYVFTTVAEPAIGGHIAFKAD